MSIHEIDGFIFKADGTPFETEKAAELRAGALKKSHGWELTPMPHDGGFVLVREGDDIDAMINDPKRPRFKFWEQPNVMMIREEDKDKRFEYRVVNSGDDFWRTRVQTLQKAGWAVVSGDTIQMNDGAMGQAKKQGSVVSQPVGKGVKGVLMRKPKKWLEEDRKAKAKINDETMAQIQRPPNVPGGAEGINQTTIETLTG